MNRYYAIFGGRNDQMFKLSGNNVALNDLHLFDLHNKHWITVALFAADTLPLSRWGHSIVSADNSGGNGSGDTILLFGGINAKNYCEGCVMYEFILDPKIIA
jgi:Galactose oxidase, central domain